MRNLQEERLRIQSLINTTNGNLISEGGGLRGAGWQLLKKATQELGGFTDDLLRATGLSKESELVQNIERSAIRNSEGKIIGGGADDAWRRLASGMNYEEFMRYSMRNNLLGNVSDAQRLLIDDLLEKQRLAGGSLSDDVIEQAEADYIEFLNQQDIFRNNDELHQLAQKTFREEADNVLVRSGGTLPEVAASSRTRKEILDDIFRKPISEVASLTRRQIRLLQRKGFVKDFIEKNLKVYFMDTAEILENLQSLIKTLQDDALKAGSERMIKSERDDIYKAIDNQLELLARKKKGLDIDLEDWLNRNLDTKNKAEKAILDEFNKSKDAIKFSGNIIQNTGTGIRQAWNSYSSITKRTFNNLKGLTTRGSQVKSAGEIVLGGNEKDREWIRKVTNLFYGSRRTPAELRQVAKELGVAPAIISYGTEAVLLRGIEIAVLVGTGRFIKNLIGSAMTNPSSFWQGWVEADEDASDFELVVNAIMNWASPVVDTFKLTGYPGIGDDLFNFMAWLGSLKSGWGATAEEKVNKTIEDGEEEMRRLESQYGTSSGSTETNISSLSETDLKTKIDTQFKDYSQEFYQDFRPTIEEIKDSITKQTDGNFTFKYDGVVYDISIDNDLIKYNVPELQGQKKNIVYFLAGDVEGIKESKKVKGLAKILFYEQEQITNNEQPSAGDIIKKYQDTFTFKDVDGNELKVNIADAELLSLWDNVKKMTDKNGEFFQDDDAFVRAVIMYLIDNGKPVYSVTYRPTSDINIALDENKKVVGLAILLEQTYEVTIYVDRMPGSGNFSLKATPGRKPEESIQLGTVDVVDKAPEKPTKVKPKKPEEDLKVDLKAKQLEKRAQAIEKSQGNLSDKLEQLIVLATTPDKYGYPNLGPCKSIFRFYYKLAIKKTKSDLISDNLLDSAVDAMSECQDRYKNITPKIVEYLSNTIPDGSEYNQFRYKIDFARNNRPIKTWRGGMMNKPQ